MRPDELPVIPGTEKPVREIAPAFLLGERAGAANLCGEYNLLIYPLIS